MVTTLMMSVKISTPSIRKIRVFWNNGYDVIVFVHDVTNKILSCDSNYIIDVVMWPKFGNCSISKRKVIITSMLWFDQKNCFFEGWSWFKFNFGLELATTLKFYTSPVKGLKLKVRTFFGLNPTFVEVTEEKLVRGIHSLTIFCLFYFIFLSFILHVNL